MLERFRYHMQPQNISLRGKLALSIAFVTLAISAASVAGFLQAIAKSNTLVYIQTANSQGVLSDKIAAGLDSISDVSLSIDLNSFFQENMQTLMQDPEVGERLMARGRISEVMYRAFQSNIISLTVLPARDVPIVWGSDSSQEAPEVLEQALALARAHQGAPAWIPSGREDGSMLCVREVRSYREPFLQHMGYIIVRVSLEKIVEEAARSSLMYPGYSMTIYREGEAIYPPFHEGEEYLPLPETREERYAILPVEGEMWFVTRAEIAATMAEWHLVLGIPYNQVFDSLVRANIIYISGLLLAILVSVAASWGILRGITHQFRLLADKMDRVSSGNLEPYPGPARPAGDELGILNSQFDVMTAEFKKVIEDNYVKELLLTQTQLKSLEQQINPHFLYNSLESIRWFAWRGGEDRVSVIAQSLGNLLRHSLSGEEVVVPVRRELGIINDYLRIQRIRFPDTLVAEVAAQEETMGLYVPKMSIQPLVENAIVHSLEENIGVCHVEIRVRREGDDLVVEVENDGSNIDEDILARMKDGTVKPKGNGIGLNNIETRIKLLYGERYGLGFANRPDRAIVSYRIPATEEPPEQAAPPRGPGE